MGLCSGNSQKGSLSVTVLMGAVIILDGGSWQGDQIMHRFKYFIPIVQRKRKDFKRERRKGDPESTANVFNEGKKK